MIKVVYLEEISKSNSEHKEYSVNSKKNSENKGSSETSNIMTQFPKAELNASSDLVLSNTDISIDSEETNSEKDHVLTK